MTKITKIKAAINRWLFSLIVMIGLCATSVFAQTTTLTTLPNPPFNGANGAGTNFSVTFVLENTNAFPVLLNDVGAWINTGEAGTFQLWYSATSLGGLPAVATPTWTMISSIALPAPAVSGINPVFSSLGFNIPAGTQYRFAFWYVTTASHYSGSGAISPNTFSGGGVNMKLGDIVIGGGNVGYGGSNTPRSFTGTVSFAPAGPCTDPPLTGTVTTTSNPVCPNTNFTLGITGGTGGLGQTYQWQSSPDNITYTNISGAVNGTLTTSQLSTNYYRYETTCGAGTAQSTGLQVTTNGTPLAGVYTLNSTLPVSATNYQTWSALALDLSCAGVSAPVTVNVNPATYTEQVSFSAIPGSSAVNTVTFNGAGSTVTFNPTVTLPHVILLNGTDNTIWNNLTVASTNITYGLSMHLWNNADNNAFNNCTFNCAANTTGTVSVPFSVSGSATSATTSGASGSNNVLTGCTMFSGYYNTCFVGNSAAANTGNQIINCNLRDFYFYGSYNLYNNGLVIRGCTIERPTRTTLSTFYGVYMSTGCTNFLVEKNRIRNPFAMLLTSTSAAYGIYNFVSGSLGLENKFYNNVISDFKSNGIAYGMYQSGASHIKIYHNTISLDYTAATGTSGHYGIYNASATANVDIRNNIITLSKGGTGIKYGLYLSFAGTICNNNVLLVNGAGGTNNYGYYGAAFGTFAAWKTANGSAFDQQSVSANPGYVSPGTYDYTPTNGVLNNIGANVGVTTDILGTARTIASPDPGAYEVSFSGTDAGITWVTPVSPITAGLKTITVNINNTASTTVTDVNLTYTDGVTPVTQAFSGLSIAPSANQNLSFTTQYNLISNASMRAWINSVNGGTDLYQSNDTTSTQNLCLSLAGAYTINSAVATGGTNFQSFSAFVSVLNCGGVVGPVTVDVVAGSGPYTEQITLGSILGVSAVNTITINGNGETIQFTAAVGPYATIWLNGVDYLSVNNLIIRGLGATTAFGVQLSNSSDNNSFTNCQMLVSETATSSTISALCFSGTNTSPTGTGNNGNNNIFTNCTFKGGYYCVSLYGNSVAPTISGNQLIGCTVSEFYLYGIYSVYNTNCLISGCTVERPTRANASTGYGIYLSTATLNTTVEKCRVRNLFGGVAGAGGGTLSAYCIYVIVAATPGNENKIYNNVVSNINTGGFIGGLYLSGAGYTKVYHNTVSLDYTAATGTGTIYGCYATGTAGMDIKDNMITISQGGTGTKYCMYISSTTTLCNYNNLFINSAGGVNNIGYYLAAYTTLASWQTANANAFDQQSTSAAPGYANPGGNDYTPTLGAVDNTGTYLLATDILGAARSVTTPDVGAYEFTPLPCSGTPAPGNTLSSANPVCSSVAFTLTLQNSFPFTGITYQWQISSDGTTWTDISGATGSSYSTSQTVAYYYQCIVTCTNGGATGTSTPVYVTMSSFLTCYCTAIPTNPNDEEISNVTLGSLNNSSVCAVAACGPGSVANLYSNYTTCVTAPNLTQFVSYPISITAFECGTGVFSSGYSVFIDFDQNGIFDAAEKVFGSTATTSIPVAGITFSGNITIPGTAVAGITRMRVIVAEGIAAPTGCQVYSYGETEDYYVNIVVATPCSGTPAVGNTISTANPVCSGNPFTLSLQYPPSFTGITYQWQSSPDGSTWANISGATNSTYTGSQTAATYYQCIVTCTNGGGTTNSTPVQLGLSTYLGCYCVPTTVNGCGSGDHITSVAINTLNNASSVCLTASYSDYTGLPATQLIHGTTYPITVHVNNGGTEYAGAWIDYDHSGTFDVSEFTSMTGVLGTDWTFTGSITIPLTALGGNTAMRVRSSYNAVVASNSACSNTYSYGETEDYLVNLGDPNCISLPTFPLNGGQACPVNLALTWPSKAGATGYDVYLDGTAGTTLVSSNQLATNYTPAQLAPGIYYWKVIPLFISGSCGTPQTWSFSVQAAPDPIANSNAPICEGVSLGLSGDNVASGQLVNTYSWTGPGFSSTQQNPSVTSSATTANSGTYTVVVTNQFLCTSSASTIVTVNPNPVLSVGGTTGVSCVGLCDGSATINASGATPDYLFTDGSNFVVGTSSGVFSNVLCEGNTVVSAYDFLGCFSDITVTVGHISAVPPSISVPNPPITGLPVSACNGSTANISTSVVPLATQYIWDGPAGTTFSGINPYTSVAPSATITFGNPNGSGYYIGVQAANGCGTSTRRVQWVRGTVSVPASITGATIACPGTNGSYSTAAITGATSYLWTVSGDATVIGTGTSATVTFGPSFTTGNLCVQAQTGCYNSAPKCITISKSAPTVPVMTGTFTACIGQTITYCVASQPGIASYTWTLPTGATGSSTTNCINVTFGAGFFGGNISVTSTTICGEVSAPRSTTIYWGTPTVPSFITGPLTGLCGQTIVYSCPSQSGVTFTWTVPAGATINSGQGTNAISVTYGTFTTSTVCVTASNACGASAARCITVSGPPNTPGAITSIPSSWCANTAGVEFNVDVTNITGSYTLSWIYPPAAVATYVLGGGNSTSLILNWISGSGPVHVTASNACGNQSRSSTQANSCREGEEVFASENTSLQVYPNPTTGNINIEFSSTTKGNASVSVMDIAGRTIASQNVSVIEGLNQTQLDLSKVAKGIYMLNVNSNEGTSKVKIVVE